MPFSIVTERLSGLLCYRVSGIASLKNYFDLIEDAARETLAQGDTRALVDLRGVVGRLPFTDQFFIGDLVARKLSHLERLANVVPDAPDTYNSAKVASRQGVDLRVFASESSALAWLHGDSGVP